MVKGLAGDGQDWFLRGRHCGDREAVSRHALRFVHRDDCVIGNELAAGLTVQDAIDGRLSGTQFDSELGLCQGRGDLDFPQKSRDVVHEPILYADEYQRNTFMDNYFEQLERQLGFVDWLRIKVDLDPAGLEHLNQCEKFMSMKVGVCLEAVIGQGN